jgi:hypothetical protein
MHSKAPFPMTSEELPLVDARERSGRENLVELPVADDLTQPVAVYLGWLMMGVLGITYLWLYPIQYLVEGLSQALPKWSQVLGAGAVVSFVLFAVERSKRDRKTIGYLLNIVTLILAALSLRDDLFARGSTEGGWYAVIAVSLYGLVHLLLLEDWVAGEAGPRFSLLAAAVRDVATVRWWFWFSKAALALRAERGRLRWQRERERAERLSAEDRAGKAAAEQRANEVTLTAVRAAEEAARREADAAAERVRAEKTKRSALEAEALRASAELRVTEARVKIEKLQREAEIAALDRSRLRIEQREAERRFLEAAIAAREAAENAIGRGVEVARAAKLLE